MKFCYKNVTRGFGKIDIIKKAKLHDNYVGMKYRRVDYRAPVGSSTTDNVKVLLDSFGKNYEGLDSRDYMIYKSGRYLGFDQPIAPYISENPILDKDPLTIVDYQITTQNLRYRDMDPKKFNLEGHSQQLQTYLNTFLESKKIEEKIDLSDVYKFFNSMDDVLGTQFKFSTLLTMVLKKVNSNLKFNLKDPIVISEFNRRDKTTFTVTNKNNNSILPINIILHSNKSPEKTKEELENEFNHSILDNIDSLRRMALQNFTKSNFGFVTDLYKWKITYYELPEGHNIELPNNFHVSLKYDFPIQKNSAYMPGILMLLKILKGALETEQNQSFADLLKVANRNDKK